MVVKIALLRKMPRGMDFLDYILGDSVKLEVGQVVEIPFRNRVVLGLVVDFSEGSTIPLEKLKTIDEQPNCLLSLPKQQVVLARKISEYYHYPLSGILKMMVPEIPKKKAAPNIEKPIVDFKPVDFSGTKKIVEQIFCSEDKKYLVFEYDETLARQFMLSVADRMIEKGKQCLLLFPNVARMSRFLRFLPKKMADQAIVITSKTLLGKNQNYAVWRGVREGKFKLVVGTRSALFLTFKELGAILVDSSHAIDYKNYDQNPRFHGITVVKWLADMFDAFLMLLSPAHRIVDYSEAKDQKWKRISLGSIDWSPKIIDFSDVYRGGFSNCFANEMIDAIQAALAAKKRALLIVNRKGEASSLVCADCDFCAKCKTCDLPLNVVGAELRCFRCGDKKDMILSCPKCGGSNLKKRGIGIDQVAKEAQRLFPSTQIEVVHGEVAANLSGDIVIATADILNYPNWPKFSILGVVYADGAVYSPDYLSNSRLYEFLNELVLRAKTDGASPRVIVQTRFAENPAIKFFGLPYSDFFEQEMEFRKQFKYPPFVNLIKLISQGDDDNAVCAAANALFDKLNKCQQSLGFGHLDLVISPPYPFYAKQVRKRFRWQILLKINRGIEFERKLMELVPKDCLIDKDPISLL